MLQRDCDLSMLPDVTSLAAVSVIAVKLHHVFCNEASHCDSFHLLRICLRTWSRLGGMAYTYRLKLVIPLVFSRGSCSICLVKSKATCVERQHRRKSWIQPLSCSSFKNCSALLVDCVYPAMRIFSRFHRFLTNLYRSFINCLPFFCVVSLLYCG